jgi:hypothetical protein
MARTAKGLLSDYIRQHLTLKRVNTSRTKSGYKYPLWYWLECMGDRPSKIEALMQDVRAHYMAAQIRVVEYSANRVAIKYKLTGVQEVLLATAMARRRSIRDNGSFQLYAGMAYAPMHDTTPNRWNFTRIARQCQNLILDVCGRYPDKELCVSTILEPEFTSLIIAYQAEQILLNQPKQTQGELHEST